MQLEKNYNGIELDNCDTRMLQIMKAKDYATLLGTFCGITAIILALPPIYAFRGAMFMIFIGVVADLLDGFIARKTGGGNAFGVELDSLSDGIVFGVAPAVIAYMNYSVGHNAVSNNLTDMGVSLHHPLIMLIACFVLVAGGIVRLAYFNISTDNSSYHGMPIPITASTLCVFMLGDYYGSFIFGEGSAFNQVMHWFIPCLMIFLAWCNTTSRINYGKTFRKKSGPLRYVFILLGISFIATAIMIIFFRDTTHIPVFILAMLFWVIFILFLFIGLKSKRNQITSEK